MGRGQEPLCAGEKWFVGVVLRVRPVLSSPRWSMWNKTCWVQKVLWQFISALSKAGWWFGTCFIVPYIWNNHPNWLIFFRGVAQPPTSYSVGVVCSIILQLWLLIRFKVVIAWRRRNTSCCCWLKMSTKVLLAKHVQNSTNRWFTVAFGEQRLNLGRNLQLSSWLVLWNMFYFSILIGNSEIPTD